MKVIRHLSDYNNQQGTAVTMGNFDGMHYGHRALLQLLVKEAAQKKLVSTVILFEPTPAEFFASNKAPARLMLLSDKIKVLQQLGVDQLICLRFNKQLSSMPADKYLQHILLHTLHMQLIILGEDAQFGYQRQGDIAFLKSQQHQHHFELMVLSDQQLINQRVSSTQIRALLSIGSMKQIKALLGDYYSMTGRIIYGNQLGRTLGFPTINIACKRLTVALSGIFVAKVAIEGFDDLMLGVAHIARRSIVNDQKPLLEVHLFNFDEQVYGKRATVYFIHKIRDTKSVADLNELKRLIEDDAFCAKQFIATYKDL